MSGATALSGAVSVRYAREQYALGYVHGRAGCADVDRADAASFARFFVTRCEDAGELVDVHEAFRDWEASR